jgi:hypothetical protein
MRRLVMRCVRLAVKAVLGGQRGWVVTFTDLRRWAAGKRAVEVALEGSDSFRTGWKKLLTSDATRSTLP